MTKEEKEKLKDALERAVYSGVKEIEFDGRKKVYHSLGEMRSLLSQLKRELSATKKQKKTYTLTHSKGL